MKLKNVDDFDAGRIDDEITTIAAREVVDIRARAAHKHVVAGAAGQRILLVRPEENVVARGAIDLGVDDDQVCNIGLGQHGAIVKDDVAKAETGRLVAWRQEGNPVVAAEEG
ncbi:hypothetical protein D9M69_522740 [compost metagenome]